MTSGMRTFLTVWVGQLVSLFGSQLSGFGLGVWVYMETGSTTRFALISLATTVPGILLSPIAGALVDRWDRRRAMILADVGAGCSTAIIALLLITGRLEMWHIYPLVTLSSAFSAFQWPAYTAATTLLVPKAQYGRASGLTQMAQAISQIAGPVSAGVLMSLVGLRGVLLMDVVSFLVAVGTLMLVRFPRPTESVEGQAARGSLWKEAAFGWSYVRSRPGLFGLLLFFAISNLTIQIVAVLFTPLVLGFASESVLGTLLSVGGLGMLAGTLVMSAWGGPKRKVYGVLLFGLAEGLVLLMGGLPTTVLVLGAAIGSYFFCFPIVTGCSQAIWQAKVPADIQGRVFAIRRMITWSVMPIAYLAAGPLADGIFEPLMAADGPLAGSIGSIIGTGPGRGIGLLYFLLGAVKILLVLWAYLYRPVRTVDEALPDSAAPTGITAPQGEMA